ncbi:hypothetical protein [Deinococcus cellulosilyticus]|uniref:Uncharacterized protein n=1 Tax=Deinococcus cellulosilyticus (strain DSM 18568 / NBRC 106333 / KACC 11606 / 5516J-15) TaxID=1223518 RepID=A0A511NAD9_DEIC1|nr:hypothetical protein [Deinococcus cellulosilyticus]GEM49792.1 hypothetical protein DC3_54270 [Deinococcus cellulosilyticus NBRC 106333 = KACC 11606]
MRMLMQAAHVETREGRISRVTTENRAYVIVRTVEHWRAGGRWWRGEYPRNYYLLRTRENTLLEVYEEVLTWTLSAIQD